MPQRFARYQLQCWSHRGRKFFPLTCFQIHSNAEVSVISRKSCSVAMSGIGEGS